MVTLRKGYWFSSCSYSNAMPKSVTLWFICRKASLCRHAACLENTSGAQLWKTAHRLAKGSKPMVTFFLSPLLHSWRKRQDTENFPSNSSLVFSKWPFNHGVCWVGLGNQLLRGRGSILNKWDKTIQLIQLIGKFSSRQVVKLSDTLKSPISLKRMWNTTM